MWSHIYTYYRIQFDESFSQSLNSKHVTEVLLSTGVLKQTDLQSFANIEPFPWIDISIYYTTIGNFAHNNQYLDEITLLDVITSKISEIEQSVYIALLRQIAIELGWKLFENEDYLIDITG